MKSPSVYRAYDAEGRVLYVGMSQSTLRRVEEHRCGSLWWPFVRNITIEHYPTTDKAYAAESLAIMRERPAFNGENDKGPSGPSYFSIADVAAAFNDNPAEVYLRIYEGVLRCIYVGSRRAIPRIEIERYIAWVRQEQAS